MVKPPSTVANSCKNQCESYYLRIEAIYCLKIWGSYRSISMPEWFDIMIICESIRIRHESNTNWYDAVRCNKVKHDGDTMQYEAVWWWWRINTIVLWYDENTIGTNSESQCECATNQYECTAVRYEPIGTDTNWYDVRQCNTTQYK